MIIITITIIIMIIIITTTREGETTWGVQTWLKFYLIIQFYF